MSSFVRCVGCTKSFKRLSTHLAQNAVCAAHYYGSHISTACDKAATNPSIANDGGSSFQQEVANTRLNSRSSSRRPALLPIRESVIEGDNELHIGNANEVDDNFVVDDDDGFVHSSFEDNHPDVPSEEEEGHADHSVFDLYEKLFKLRSNPLGLERFSLEEKVQIELLQLLRDLKAPLKAFTLVLNWAAKSNASGHVFKEGCQPSREKVMRNLYERYNMNGLIPKEKQLYLPYSQRTVSVVYFNASEVFASLLSCPTLNQDEIFLFDSAKDPFVAPSGKASHVGDINTGRGYRKTYKALVKDIGVDILLPCIMAMDKTHIDMAGRLQMEPITLSHGLLKHTVRRLPIAMRILGYINHSAPAHLPAISELDINFNAPSGLPHGTVVCDAPLRRIKDVTWPTYLLNELHIQIQFILEESGFLRLQRKGFRWNLHYNRKIHPVVFRLYVPFIIGDTEGHDRLCGHYTARFSKIQQLCRICECPTYLTGYSKSKFPHRMPKGINKLVRNGNTMQLKMLSQNYLKNGFDEVRFGQHNQRGIFGACPGEMLHLISLGWFKYCLEAFSSQAGGTNSVALKQYDRLCATLGSRLSRQSDRDIPRTNFPKGFSSGSNLMGHEMAGCLLVKLFALHTTYFHSIFSVGNKRKAAAPPEEQRLRNEAHVSDWILVISSLLTWHQWMKQPTIAKKQVKASHVAVQWLMRLVATVAPRTTGMTNNTIKKHLVLHLCEDILDHGVPDNVNSAFAESAHIPLAKMTSRNTQKRAISFTKQAAHRYVENIVVSLASADVVNDRKLKGHRSIRTQSMPMAAPNISEAGATGKMSGRKFTLSWFNGDESATFEWYRKGPSDDPEKSHLSHIVTDYLANFCLPHMPNSRLPCFTEFITINNDLFRAHPCYDGRQWNDHAMVKWFKLDAHLPALIHTFVDLRGLPKGKSISIRSTGQKEIRAGLYALVHSFDAVDEKEIDSENTLIGRYTLHRQSPSEKPTLYLVDVESLRSPTVGIPDVGCALENIPKHKRHHLFLIRRKVAWPQVWDSIINSSYDTDDIALEKEYENVATMANGTEVLTVKTAKEVAADAAARDAALDTTGRTNGSKKKRKK